ncbi:MAG: hypothetical protein ACOY8P_05060 [Thermodesulfobacteriota bacterium]
MTIKPEKQYLGDLAPGDKELAEAALAAIERLLGPQPEAVRDDILAGVLWPYLANRNQRDAGPDVPHHVPLSKTRKDVEAFLAQVDALRDTMVRLKLNEYVTRCLLYAGYPFEELQAVLDDAEEAASCIREELPANGQWNRPSPERDLIQGLAAHFRSITGAEDLRKECRKRNATEDKCADHRDVDQYQGRFFEMAKAVFTELDVNSSVTDSALGKRICRAMGWAL